MAHFPRFISKQMSRFVTPERLYGLKTPVFLPFYHVVSNEQLPYILNYPYRNEKDFESELEYILKYFSPVSLEELIKNPQPKKQVTHFTFDDGLRQCAEVIAPLLYRRGIPATFFINSGFVDNKDLFHRYKASLILNCLSESPDSQAELFLAGHKLNRANLLRASFNQNDILDEAAEMLEIDFGAFLQEHQPYMSTQQVIDLNKKGFTIGAHGHDHNEFWELKPKKQFQQVEKSMDWVNKHIQPKIRAFSFPFTDDGIKQKLLTKLKTENVCDVTFGTAGLKYDSFETHFQRVPMEKPNKIESFLKEEFMYFKLRKLLNRATVRR